MKQHAAEYNMDPDRIALVGESAGAQLASMAALAPGTGVKAVVAFYSPSDLASLAQDLDICAGINPAPGQGHSVGGASS